MTLFEHILRKLDARQAQLAHDALRNPQKRDAFEYGRMAGMYAGFSEARDIVTELIEETDRRDADL